jgi:Vitamin K-dependent gamma-carboxylase
VKLKSLVETWNGFFFSPQSPLPLALFRIIYGALITITLLFLRPDWLNWYGAHAWVSLPTMHQMEPGTRLNLFTLLPQSDRWIEALFWVFLVSAVSLTAGFFTRLNTVVVFLCLTSIHQRNLYILHGGDTFLRVAGFFLMFAAAGAALSVDRLMRIRRGREGTAIRSVSPWAQRMIQFELAILYFAAFCGKAQGAPWIDGTALYYVYHLEELRRFPVPAWFLHPMLLKLGSWSALLVEFSLGTLIWIKELRYYILAAGLLFHLFIEYSLNIPLFEWDILSGYILFVDAADLTRFWKRVRTAVKRLDHPAAVKASGAAGRYSPRSV